MTPTAYLRWLQYPDRDQPTLQQFWKADVPGDRITAHFEFMAGNWVDVPNVEIPE